MLFMSIADDIRFAHRVIDITPLEAGGGVEVDPLYWVFGRSDGIACPQLLSVFLVSVTTGGTNHAHLIWLQLSLLDHLGNTRHAVDKEMGIVRLLGERLSTQCGYDGGGRVGYHPSD